MHVYSFLPSFSNRKGILKTTLPLFHIPHCLVHVHTDVYIVAFSEVHGILISNSGTREVNYLLTEGKSSLVLSKRSLSSELEVTDCIMLSTYVIKV